MSGIKDELVSFIFLKDLKVYISEYIPFGSNHIIAFNDELDCQKEVKDGLMTSFVDMEPAKATFKVEEDLTKVTVTQYDPNDYVMFNASIAFEEVVEQQEELSVYVDAYGRIIYGTKIEEIDDEAEFSIDKLSRVFADIVIDTSQMMNSLLTTYQRRLLELVYFGTPEFRNKFVIMVAKEITPDKKAIEFHDGEDLENELNQVLTLTTEFKDLENGTDRFFYGTEGLLLVSSNPEKYEDLLSIAAFYLGLDIFQKNYFQKMFMLWDEIKESRKLMNMGDIDPNAISEAKAIISEVSAAVVLMNELLSFMRKSCENMNNEWAELDKSDPNIQEIIETITLQDMVGKALTRIEDAKLVVSGLTEEIGGINGLVNSLAEKQMARMNESLRDSIASMDAMGRSSERTGASLNVLEILLAGTIAFDVLFLMVGEYSWEPLAGWIASVPGIFIWTGICLSSFFAVGYFMLRLTQRMESESEPNLRTKITIGKPYNKEKFENFLADKEIIIKEAQIFNETIIEDFTWDEDDEKWLGNEARIKLRSDTTNSFILNVLVNIDSPKDISVQQVSSNILDSIKDLISN